MFVPAASFYTPQQYREVCDKLPPRDREHARDHLVRLRDGASHTEGRKRWNEYLDALDA